MDRDSTVVTGDVASSSSDSDSEMEEDAMDTAHEDSAPPAAPPQPLGPVIDEEGFELVQKRRPRSRAKG